MLQPSNRTSPPPFQRVKRKPLLGTEQQLHPHRERGQSFPASDPLYKIDTQQLCLGNGYLNHTSHVTALRVFQNTFQCILPLGPFPRLRPRLRGQLLSAVFLHMGIQDKKTKSKSSCSRSRGTRRNLTFPLCKAKERSDAGSYWYRCPSA